MQPKPNFCCVFLARAPYLIMQSASPNEAKPETVLASTAVQIPGRAMNSAELHPTLFSAGGIAATEGQCCSSAGATRWNMEIRSSGSSMYVPHVITICSACIHSSVNKLTDNISIVSADCQHASAHVCSSPAILILSRISPVTSDCKAAEASWQLSLQIQTVLLWHSVSQWTRSLSEAEIRRHLIRDKSRYILKKGNRNVHKTNAVITGAIFMGHHTSLWEPSFLYIQDLPFPSDFSALLDLTSWGFHWRWNCSDSQGFQETRGLKAGRTDE